MLDYAPYKRSRKAELQHDAKFTAVQRDKKGPKVLVEESIGVRIPRIRRRLSLGPPRLQFMAQHPLTATYPRTGQTWNGLEPTSAFSKRRRSSSPVVSQIRPAHLIIPKDHEKQDETLALEHLAYFLEQLIDDGGAFTILVTAVPHTGGDGGDARLHWTFIVLDKHGMMMAWEERNADGREVSSDAKWTLHLPALRADADGHTFKPTGQIHLPLRRHFVDLHSKVIWKGPQKQKVVLAEASVEQRRQDFAEGLLPRRRN